MKCNLCNYQGEFQPMGNRENARCPQCKSLERHREFIEIYDGEGSILHISPNRGLIEYFQRLGNYEYSVYEDGGWDLLEPNEGIYDNIIAIHVLEHIENDTLALTNIYDALSIGGVFWLQVPFEKELRKDLGHVTKFTKRGLKAKLTRAGFEYEEKGNFFKCVKK